MSDLMQVLIIAVLAGLTLGLIRLCAGLMPAGAAGSEASGAREGGAR